MSLAQNLSKSIIRRIFANVYITPGRHLTYVQFANAVEEAFPIATLYCSAQVCRSWRSALLDSPELWARCMDLIMLLIVPGFWKTIMPCIETSSCKLHVQAILPPHSEVVDYVKEFLNTYWERIQVLSLTYSEVGLTDEIPPDMPSSKNIDWMEAEIWDIFKRPKNIDWMEAEIWDIFKRPAPSLNFFSIETMRLSKVEFTKVFPIFSNNAPLLQYFGGIIFRIDPRANWLSHIRSLLFNCSFSASQLLDVLSTMPLLEALGIYDNGMDNTKMNFPFVGSVSMPRVVLPKLSYISIHLQSPSSSYTKYLKVLDHLTPSQNGCSLTFRSIHKLNISSTDLALARRVKQAYFQRSLQIQEPTAVMLLLSHTSIKIVCPEGRAVAVQRASGLVPGLPITEVIVNGGKVTRTSQRPAGEKNDEDEQLVPEQGMIFRFEMDSTERIPSAAEFLNGLPDLRIFKQVKDLVVLVYPAPDALLALDVAATMIMSTADALETLDTTTDVLGHILSMPRSNLSFPLFPCLKKLCVSRSSKAALDVTVLRAFFEHMKPKLSPESGGRNFHLDLNMSANMLKGCDLRFLDQFQGLKITWDQWDADYGGYWREACFYPGSYQNFSRDLDFTVFQDERAHQSKSGTTTKFMRSLEV
ncbi:hypothetical protein CVT26_006779 [Gymnopilus dilepis]|uniref:F-box domain-containing protein n=1 Tax=Gymnopilus dilepis TaxID=231916 RepID=A0A409Y361_9AGAR|nr:hypothetical protein CVT26_006779 [Gymnopilus dilepis]